jgi:hypothetical protein
MAVSAGSSIFRAFEGRDEIMAEKLKYKLQVELTLKWLKGREYEATVAVEITDSCYHEVDLKVGLPPGTVGILEVEYLTYTLTHDSGKECGAIARIVSKSIPIVFSDTKPKVTAFAVVNGQVAGSDTKPFPKGK